MQVNFVTVIVFVLFTILLVMTNAQLAQKQQSLREKVLRILKRRVAHRNHSAPEARAALIVLHTLMSIVGGQAELEQMTQLNVDRILEILDLRASSASSSIVTSK